MERNTRTTFQGVVTSTKNDKTITVVIETKRNHPLYGKRVGYSTKIRAHDENNVAEVGDTVTVMACRPMSATKRFRLVSVDKKAQTIVNAEAAEASLEANEGSAAEVETAKEAE
ncbi:MAG: 30S ribosomal protein S17 [Bacilli bacterium]|jgi:small subunit ribosomal protein S17|nr:30S ribosomal protein S17 [Bacilli bacterium]